MNLNKFRNAFTEGFQQNNRFLLQLALPLDLKDRITQAGAITRETITADPTLGTLVNTDVQNDLSLTRAYEYLEQGLVCDSARVPDRSFDTVQMTQYGVTEQFPYKTDYTTLDATFLLPTTSGHLGVARWFYLWQDFIQGVQSGSRNFEWPDNYYAKAKLYTLDRQSFTTGCYTFDKLYPKAVESIPMTWADNSELAHLGVTFVFTSWSFSLDAAPLDAGVDLYPEVPFTPERFDDGVKHGTSWLQLTVDNLLGAAEGWVRNKVYHTLGSKGENHKPEPNFTPQTFTRRDNDTR